MRSVPTYSAQPCPMASGSALSRTFTMYATPGSDFFSLDSSCATIAVSAVVARAATTSTATAWGAVDTFMGSSSRACFGMGSVGQLDVANVEDTPTSPIEHERNAADVARLDAALDQPRDRQP